ncbi:MAG: aminotransferase class V-fold PLP-dependent enzyme [Bacteroidetes bacterium]|nr:aminotransferase class V-fold PLP-dependent enzyme [Bacteroidota bacterium]
MITISNVRDYFPHIKDGVIFFNNASTGPLSIPVIEEMNLYIKENSNSDIDGFRSFLSREKESKIMIAEMINTTTDRIAFVDNTSNGINYLAQGINWEKGDRILLNDLEFPANVYPFLNLKEAGVEVDFVKSKNGIVTADDLIEGIKPGTKLIAVSQVQFLTGYRINLEKLGDECKKRNIILLVDAIQSCGVINPDVKKMNIGFLSAGTQKWMLGLQGLGFIYLSEEVQKNLKQRFVGWKSVVNAWNILDYDLTLREEASRFQNGTISEIGIYAIYASLKLLNEIGFNNIEKTVLDNASYLTDRLLEIGLKPLLAGCRKENRSGIVACKIDNAQTLYDELLKENIHIAVREGYIRFSPNFYNNREDINKVIAELKKLV